MTSGDGKVGILGLGAYVPERVMTNADWGRLVDTTDEWIVARTGIEKRHFAADDESTVDLAVAAGRAALADAGLEPEDVDEIIVATDTPEVFSPDTAAFVQHQLGARQVPSYDLAGSGCAGFVQALDVACSRVLARRPEKVLVIGAEVITRLMNWTDRATCVLFGDAAGAAVVGRGAANGEIVAVETGTDGSRTGILGLPIGGTRHPFSLDVARRGLHKQIVMNGREVFKEAVTRMSEASRKVLAKAGRELAEVALVVPHQANLRIISAVAKALETPMDKVFVNVREYGNTGSASVPLALTQARGQGRIQDGDLVLLTSFGAGFHWAAALIQF